MDKRSFVSELRYQLSDMPDDVVNRQIESYSLIIDGMVDNGVTEEEAVAAMGDPVLLAAKIRRSSGTYNTPVGQSTGAGGYGYDINDSLYNNGRKGYDYGDGFSGGSSQGGNNSNGGHESVTGRVMNAPEGNNGYNRPFTQTKSGPERIILIVIACVLFMPALIGMYCAAVGILIAGVTVFGIGLWPMFTGSAMLGLLVSGIGLVMHGAAILMMMGLNRLIKLVTGQYHLIK